MSLNLFTRSTLAMTGALLSVGAVAINPASAARITYDFSGIMYEGPGQYGPIPLTGRFTYDEATEVTTFDEYSYAIGTGGSRSLEIHRYELEIKQYEVDFIEFSFLDKVYVYTQFDPLSPLYWTVEYLKGEDDPFGKFIEWWVTVDGYFLFKGDRYGFGRWTSFYSAEPDGSTYIEFSRVKEEPISVPEPTLLGGLSVLGLAGLLGKKRRKAQAVD